MQKLMKEHLDKLNRQRQKRRRMEIAVVLLVVVVMTSVVGILTQYGFALTVEPKCGIEEHQHDEACYHDVLVCSQEEGAKHQHGEACYQASTALSCGQEEREGHQHGDGCYQPETKNVCGQEEGEEHQHEDACFVTEMVLTCGQEEREGHRHTEACFQSENVLVCGQNEDEGHHHTDACHEMQLACEKEEHVHTDWCRIDVNADVESASKWDAQYANVQWKDSWGEDLVTAAEKQLGYKESEENYWIAEDGSHKGYTRYGQFANDVYVDWDAAFVNFCLHYAGLDDSKMFLDETDTARWHERFVREKDNGYLIVAEGYEPKPGDLVFFDRQGEETEKQMGIVSSYDKDRNKIKVIEGNSANEVKENEYAANDEHIFAYLQMTEMEQVYKAAMDVTEPDVEGTPEEDGEQAEEPAADGEEEPIVELVTEVGDTTITLSGPASSFEEVEEGKEYSIEAELIVASEQKISTQSAADEESVADDVGDETTETDDGESVVSDERIEAIEEAVTKIAEEKEREVESYQAFDIKLMLDGEEVQPLGPVSVKFSSNEVARAVEDEATEVNVIHVDETSGEVTDMEATTTEENDVVIETEHFSVYIYVNLGENILGKITVTVEHWGEGIAVIDGEASAVNGVDTVFEKGVVKQKEINCKIYSTDTLEIPNEYYADVTKLSKVCNVHDGMNYTVSKVWVSENIENKDQETWVSNSYTEYIFNDMKDIWITLTDNSLIRFWYIPVIGDNKLPTKATFYDYNITDGNVYSLGKAIVPGNSVNVRSGPGTSFGTLGSYSKGDTVTLAGNLQKDSDGGNTPWYPISYGDSIGYMRSDLLKVTLDYYDQYLKTKEKGINASSNFEGTSIQNKMGVGQQSSGNLADWATTARGGNGKLLNAFNRKKDDPEMKNSQGVVGEIVQEELTPDGDLQFNGVNAPKNLFNVVEGTYGSTPYTNYQLRFKQNGDTYTLQNVYNSDKEVNAIGAGNLLDFTNYGTSNNPAWSNDFWPMDDVSGSDPHMGESQRQYIFLNDEWKEVAAADAPHASDDGKNHNWHFGMVYSIEFTVGDYTGPMEYYFRGDDDFWLFVDGKRAVDIGGIHTSAGESLDLREWMTNKGLLADDIIYEEAKDENGNVVYEEQKDENGNVKLDADGNPLLQPKLQVKEYKKHTLKVFYMERGGFGSCCYMQFTLPNSKPITVPTPRTTQYTVTKSWDDGNSPYRPDSITVQLLQILNGKTSETSVTAKLTKENNWTYTWTGLPEINGASQGIYTYSYSVQEVNLPPGYVSVVDENTGLVTNKLISTKVKVNKEWVNDEWLDGEMTKIPYRPNSVTVRLYANGEEYRDTKGNVKEVVLSAANGWSAEFDNLPKYYYENVGTDDKPVYTAKKVEYSVKEIGEKAGTVSGLDGSQYAVQYTNNMGDEDTDQADQNVALDSSSGVESTEQSTGSKPIDKDGEIVADWTITNTLVTKFKIVKKGSDTQTAGLEGAKFSLIRCDDQGNALENETGHEVASGEDGVLNFATYLSNGNTYLLREVEAPVGYVISPTEWVLQVGEKGRATIWEKTETGLQLVEAVDKKVENGDIVLYFDFYNEVIYALPSTGGLGIYLYMLGGVLLMSAAAFITYSNKRKGVLKS